MGDIDGEEREGERERAPPWSIHLTARPPTGEFGPLTRQGNSRAAPPNGDDRRCWGVLK
jgi:hypothetical protein